MIYPQISHSRQHSLDVIFGICVRRDMLVSVPTLSHMSTALAAHSEGSSGDSADMKGRQKQFPLAAQKVFSLSSCLHRTEVMKASPLLH